MKSIEGNGFKDYPMSENLMQGLRSPGFQISLGEEQNRKTTTISCNYK